MPPACLALLQQWTAIHELSYAAAKATGTPPARRSSSTRSMTDMYDIDPMLNDFASSLGHWMPKFVKGKK